MKQEENHCRMNYMRLGSEEHGLLKSASPEPEETLTWALAHNLHINITLLFVHKITHTHVPRCRVYLEGNFSIFLPASTILLPHPPPPSYCRVYLEGIFSLHHSPPPPPSYCRVYLAGIFSIFSLHHSPPPPHSYCRVYLEGIFNL